LIAPCGRRQVRIGALYDDPCAKVVQPVRDVVNALTVGVVEAIGAGNDWLRLKREMTTEEVSK
jgi:hypothetical protein